MFRDKKISLVIPCFNEEAGIDMILNKIPPLIDETIVIDNGSTDRTGDIAKKRGANVVQVKERGYGVSYRAGLPLSTGDIIITMDGDDSYPLNPIENMLTHMDEQELDFMSACRFPLQDRSSMPFINRIANVILSVFIRSFFKVNIIDSQSGMWIFKKSIINQIISNNSGMGFSQEIKLNAWLNGSIKCCEFHIPYKKRKGQVKLRRFKDGLKSMLDILIFWKKKQKFRRCLKSGNIQGPLSC